MESKQVVYKPLVDAPHETWAVWETLFFKLQSKDTESLKNFVRVGGCMVVLGKRIRLCEKNFEIKLIGDNASSV